jgi:DNA polymerase-3 subunit delta'
MPFSELIAQDRALSPLRSALRRGALHHAYLFGGPEGVGKGRAARLLAQAANCEGSEAAPSGARDDACGACGPCRKIEKGVHPDVLFLAEERVMAKAGAWEPKGGRSPSKDIVVDQVRDLVDRRLSLRRFEGRRRFVVIDPADAMNAQAQNALLKTLEEPPADTTLVLVASSPDALLPTIRSRCARVSFGPLPDPFIQGKLAELEPGRIEKRVTQREKEARAEGRDLGPEERRLAEDEVRRELRIAVALASGSLSRALGTQAELEGLREAIEDAVALPADDAGAWLRFAGRHGDDREHAGRVCEVLQLWLRDVAAAQAGAAALALPDLASATRRAAAALAPAEALRRRREVQRTAAALRQNASPVLALEALLVRWFHGR